MPQRKPIVTDAPLKVAFAGRRQLERDNPSATYRVSGVISWFCHEENKDGFTLEWMPNATGTGNLQITVKSPGGLGGSIGFVVSAELEICNYGGSRWRFLCPLTGKRCAHIYYYRGLVGSREGLGLKYQSQLLTTKHRRFNKTMDFAFPENNPKYAHRYRYRNGKATKKWARLLRLRQSTDDV